MVDATKIKPKTKPKPPSKKLPTTKPTKAMIKMGLRKEFVDSENPASFNNTFPLGRVANYVAGLLSPEYKEKVNEAKRDSATAKKKKNFQGVTTIKRKQKGGKVNTKKMIAGGKVKKRKK